MSDADEAKTILENRVFKLAMDRVEEYFVERIKRNPTEDVEAAIGLRVLEEIHNTLGAMVFDQKAAEHTKEMAKRVQ